MSYDASQFAPSTGGGDIFETGEYLFHIVESSAKQTKSGNGTMLLFELACLEPELAGKRLTIRLNVVNPSTQAVEIAMRDLSAISHVTGVMQWTDTQQLHGKPFRVRVEKTPRNDDPEKMGNEIRAFMDASGNPPGQVAAAAPAGAPPAPVPAPAAAVAAPAPAPAAVVPPPAAAPVVAAPAVAPVAAPAAPVVATPAAPPAPSATPPWVQP